MKNPSILVAEATVAYIKNTYSHDLDAQSLTLQSTRKDFDGDITLVVFPLTRITRKSPAETAIMVGEALKSQLQEIAGFNVIQGFLNIIFTDSFWLEQLKCIQRTKDFGFIPLSDSQQPVLVEFSSPNTNKPLHLGHIRNNLLGASVSRILSANGHKVIKVNLVNDRGIHICKSMLAWQKWGNGESPETSGMKGDHLVGKYYVEFDKHFKSEVASLVSNGIKPEDAEKQVPIMLDVREMLIKWEAGDKEVRQLWSTMNGWVYNGFNITYQKMGIEFDKIYYESNTYLEGKSIVREGLENGILTQKEDGSVWIDLTRDGLDEKLLLRSDGTSVYMTQDLGTADLRFKEFHPQSMIYVVGNEQNYHFDVLKIALSRLNKPWAETIRHLSYGMVELPDGKMKSREGTVVDADDLMDQMYETARQMTEELGKANDMTDYEAAELYRKVSLAALKYFILKVDPKKNMLFNPADSIDFNGNTGPFIQYTFARIRSIMRKIEQNPFDIDLVPVEMGVKERQVVRLVMQFPQIVNEAGKEMSPALIANYCFDLAKEFNQFYHDFSILHETSTEKKAFRIVLAWQTSEVLRNGMSLLGIEMPERM